MITTDRQPLTEQQIAEIEARDYRRDQNGAAAYRQSDLAAQDVPALLATVELLRRELELLRAELPHMCERVREQAAQELRDRAAAINASRGENNDPLANAIWETCHRHPEDPATFDDPRRIAQVVYEHIATTITQEKP